MGITVMADRSFVGVITNLDGSFSFKVSIIIFTELLYAELVTGFVEV